MGTKGFTILCLGLAPVMVFGQKLSFTVSPTIETGFSILSNSSIERNDMEYVSLEPLTKMGNIGYVPIIYGMGLYLNNGSKMSYGIHVGHTEVVNGYKFTTFKSPTVSSDINYSLTTGFSRLYINGSIRRSLMQNEQDFGYLGIDFGVSKNLSGISEMNYKYFNEITSSDTMDASIVQRLGYSLTVTYGLPIYGKPENPLFHLVLKYSQGFRVINKGYFSIWDANNNYINISSPSYGSQISIGIVKNISFAVRN